MRPALVFAVVLYGDTYKYSDTYKPEWKYAP